jgi:signal transduction histidine kinase
MTEKAPVDVRGSTGTSSATPRTPRVDVLVVDDKPEKLLSIAAVLEDLDETIVLAASGREALRHVLRQSFAVILLDINMPGMDGFEIAQMVRSYRPSRHTPIIFMTAAGDDALLAKSYALGGVDYLLTPAAPEVLRSKVRVFAELHRKSAEVERQAAALSDQAAQLGRLAAASIQVSAARSLDAIVQALAETARDLCDAHQALVTLTVHREATRGATSFSETLARFRSFRPDRRAEALYLLARPRGGPARLTQREIEADPALRAAAEALGGAPLRGLLAAPVTDGDGRWLGLVQVSGRRAGDFSPSDEAVLVQLAQLGSSAVQNCLHAQAREANRLKDEFLATLSHELRTPLQALLGWTRILRRGTVDPARLARGLEVIERNAKLQATLIDDLLDISRIIAGKLNVETFPVAIAPVVAAAVDTLRPTADAKGIALSASLGDDAAHVLGDAARLQQVFSNLVGNAVKFTARGGRVDVIVAQVAGEVVVRVADTGVGIDPEFLPFVFERFRQADSSSTRAQGGLGLGLAVVLHLTELHGGSVRAESAGRGQGATFSVRLPALATTASRPFPRIANVAARWPPEPVYDGRSAGSADYAGSAPKPSLEPEAVPASGVQTLDGVRVLVVDDDEDARELLREVLAQRRAVVATASSARDALDGIDAHHPHVLVSDIGMKGEDGYDLIRQVRGRPPQHGGAVPALALTAYTRDEDRLRAMAAGFQMHAHKPIDPDKIVDAVAALAGAQGSHEVH